jgi:multiple sugar transport system ATP-binding protein
VATVSLEHVSKVYPNGAKAVTDLNLDVADGEFMILVGPSGCGKTTALRMVAGLEDISDGTIRVGGRVVNDIAPQQRDIAMVFQNYALYPHMTVAENIGFALKLRKMSKEEIRSRVQTAAGILGLTEHLDRKPSQLSGGQRQRVAMGRAIVREPAVFLMDEPLSNLDAKLRVQMRAEIARVQRRLGVATLYVTHDQTEAMTMGDRVAVLRAGELQQCDAPQALYDAPANVFVAAFIGSPAMNLYEATVSPEGTALRIGGQTLSLPASLSADPALAPFRGRDVVVGIRPENLQDAAASGQRAEGRRLEGDVEIVEALGSEKLVHFRVDAGRVQAPGMLAADDEAEDAASLGAGEIGAAALTAGVARVVPTSTIRAGERASFVVDTERLHLFDPSSGTAIRGGRAVAAATAG